MILVSKIHSVENLQAFRLAPLNGASGTGVARSDLLFLESLYVLTEGELFCGLQRALPPRLECSAHRDMSSR
jgi:hypothetical protein